MPFICLANANLPGGTLQITDLWPNESQRNGSIDPPGQNRYLRRPGQDIPAVDPQSGNVVGSPEHSNKMVFEGLAAYLVDRVEPGSSSTAEATVTLAGVQAGDRITIKGIIFEFAAGNNDLAGRAGDDGDPFLVGLGAGDGAAATNLADALNDDADVGAAMDAVDVANVHTLGTADGTDVLIQAETAVLSPLSGRDGQLTVTTSTGVRLALDVENGRLTRTFDRWTSALLTNALTGIQDRVANGQALDITAINTELGSRVSGDLDGSGATSSSTGTLSELLSILAGRKYHVPAGANKFTAAVAPDTVSLWVTTQRGSFTSPNTVFDEGGMLGGEWGPTGAKWVKHGHNKVPTVSGGDSVNVENGPVRSTFDGSHFANSVQSGQLAQFAAGVTLFPDAEVQARVAPTLVSKQSRQATLVNQRLVTVYDDDGTVLA